MEYLINEGSRVIYLGDTSFKHELATVVKICRRNNGTEYVALNLKSEANVFTEFDKVRPIFVDDSIPNGVNLADCCVRPFDNHEGQYMPDDAIGKAFKVGDVYPDGITVNVDDEAYGNHYWLRHDCYHVVPNVKTAWIWKGTKIVYEDVLFKHYDKDHVVWETCDGNEIIKDRLVYNDVTEALDFGRKIMTQSAIKVIR